MILPTTIIRSPKRKRSVALTIEPDGSLRVLAPKKVSQAWIEAFIREKTAWINRRRSIVATKKERAATRLTDGSSLPLQGKLLSLSLCQGPNASLIHNPEQLSLTISLPEGLSEEMAREEIKTELVLWYRKQARLALPSRMAFWAGQMGVHPTRLSISKAQHQWGSCNSKNEIRLNWRLITTAPEIIDYVIVHELAHITHKNHGNQFWKMVEKHIPDMKKRRQALRKWEEIYPPSSFP
ncbi:MAG: SprT family zinc-dependent metalloprotease [Alphaproteobacteria bacterium]|nr:SprT family zinc-dependent metalloprotease [Alphaproteobacteria bacterium]